MGTELEHIPSLPCSLVCWYPSPTGGKCEQTWCLPLPAWPIQTFYIILHSSSPISACWMQEIQQRTLMPQEDGRATRCKEPGFLNNHTDNHSWTRNIHIILGINWKYTYIVGDCLLQQLELWTYFKLFLPTLTQRTRYSLKSSSGILATMFAPPFVSTISWDGNPLLQFLHWIAILFLPPFSTGLWVNAGEELGFHFLCIPIT